METDFSVSMASGLATPSQLRGGLGSLRGISPRWLSIVDDAGVWDAPVDFDPCVWLLFIG